MSDSALERQLVLVTRRRNTNALCAKCGAAFTCGVVSADAHCWCFDLPKLAALDVTATACYCPDCLSALTRIEADTAR